MNSKCKILAVTLLGMGIVGSCTKDEVSNSPENPETAILEQGIEGEEDDLFVSEIENPKEITYFGQKIIVNDVDGAYIFNGDIEVDPDDPELNAKGAVRTQKLWKNKTVPYTIADDVPNKKRIYGAMSHITAKTGIKFVKRKKQKDYVQFVKRKKGCSSKLGRVGGSQPIRLSDKCSRGSVIHEIGHALGVLHEMARTDRGKYIKIHWKNIRKGRENNFQTFKQRGFKDGKNVGKFDFNSIMMYKPTAFRKNKKVVTISKKDGSSYKTQRNWLSKGDVAAIKSLYK